MADERFKGLWVPIPFVAITMLIVFVLQLIIRLWMLSAPQWERKCVRNPQEFTYGLPEPPRSSLPAYQGLGSQAQDYTYTNKAYSGYMGSSNYPHRSGYSSPGGGYGAATGQYPGHYQPARPYARQY